MLNYDVEDILNGWRELAENLCSFRTGVNTTGNMAMFERLRDELPFTIRNFPAESEFNGWVIPKRWTVEKAEIRKDGNLLFDGKAHPLGVGMQSRSFQGTLDLDQLWPHIVTNKDLPSAHMFHCVWQYRPWAADWMFCVPWEVASKFEPGEYEIELIVQTTPEPMQVAEYRHEGESPLTFVFQAHTCHPGQAEDGFGAVALLVRLFQWLQGKKTRFSYLLLFGPEHLGTVFWLKDKAKKELERILGGIFMEMPGLETPLKATSSFLGSQYVDNVTRHVLQTGQGAYELVPWRCGAGNDETVWEAPGYEVPFVELTRCKDTCFPYATYHSSLDIVSSMDETHVCEMWGILKIIIKVIEHNSLVYRNFDGLICLSNPQYDLYPKRYDPSICKYDDNEERMGKLIDSLFRYFDGTFTILDIALHHELPFFDVYNYIVLLKNKDLLMIEPYIPQRNKISVIKKRNYDENRIAQHL